MQRLSAAVRSGGDRVRNQKVLRGYSEGAQRVLKGQSEGNQRVLRGYSEGNQRVLKGELSSCAIMMRKAITGRAVELRHHDEKGNHGENCGAAPS